MLIDTPAALEDLVGQLASESALGMDTEFMRERTYRAELCLLQVTVADEPHCIDPLALEALTPLKSVMASPRTEKILHSARQDLEVLWPLTGPLTAVFDTQIAAALAGFAAQIGYAELVKRLLGVELTKGQTRTDWSRRPLSAAQVEYALDDVRYLRAIRDHLEERLEHLGRVDWLREDLLKLVEPAALQPDPSRAWQRFKGISQFDEGRQRLLKALAEWRERRAIQKNRPRGWILDDAFIKEITEKVPRDMHTLAQIPGLPEGIVKHSGEELCALIADAAIEHPAPPLPKRERPDPAIVQRTKYLGDKLKRRAAELEIVSEVLATRKELEALATGRPLDQVLGGWRLTVLADVLTD